VLEVVERLGIGQKVEHEHLHGSCFSRWSVVRRRLHLIATPAHGVVQISDVSRRTAGILSSSECHAPARSFGKNSSVPVSNPGEHTRGDFDLADFADATAAAMSVVDVDGVHGPAPACLARATISKR